MANPTTNYSFVLPTSSDLVTDLPADFDVALQGVDTRLKALQPGTTLGDLAYSSATANTNTRLPIGTTGQVLAVSGGVPAWTTTADVTPLTTKGDLFTFTTVDARLGIGANNTILTADSAEATGMKWSALPGNVIDYTAINSGGTALTGATTITISGISGKSSLMILVDGASSANASSSFSVRFNSDSGANYGAVGLVVTNTAAGNTGGFYGGQQIDIAKMTNSGGGACSFNMIVSGTNATGRKFVTASSGGDVGTGSEFRSINGWYSGTSAISSVSLISSTGNFDAGTIYVFGA